MKYDVVIIGSGLGGLECGYMLAKNGMNVCILERSTLLGGCLQSFRRGPCHFDTGFHYIGALGEGESLNRLFTYYNLMELPWERMDNVFDEVCIDGTRYPFANGHANFVEALAQHFPEERSNLKRYTDFLSNVGDHIFDSIKPRNASDFYSTSLFARSAREFINETTGNQRLRDVLCGTSLKMELHDKLPLYVFAQINDSFIRSAWRIKGNGSLIAEHLADDIRKMGGTVTKNCPVEEIIEKDGKAIAVKTGDGEIIECEWVISNAHPVHTISLLKNSTAVRKIYRNRINNLENTFGMFTVNLRLKEDILPYSNRNLYVYENADMWNYTPGKTDRMLVSYYHPEQGSHIQRLDLLTPMCWSEVERWADKPIGHRGDDYVEFKKRKTNELIQMANKHIKGLADAVERDYTSTPITYESYSNTKEGSAYGIRKDYNNPMLTVLTPRTPVQNLLLTGQSLNLHGILGVSMTSLFTSAEILGMDTIRKELNIE